eukprot:3817430-Prymnesium_polylepis.1
MRAYRAAGRPLAPGVDGQPLVQRCGEMGRACREQRKRGAGGQRRACGAARGRVGRAGAAEARAGRCARCAA